MHLAENDIFRAGQEAVTKTARGIFAIVDKAGDEPTADLLTQRMQVHEKNAWMLRSLLEGGEQALPATGKRKKK